MRNLEEELSKKTKFQKALTTAILLLLLFVFPVGSWYYLKAGMKYQLEARAELGDLGKIKNFNLLNQNDKNFSPKNLRAKFLVVGFLDPYNKEQEKKYLKRLAKLHKQFARRPDVKLISNLLVDSTEADNYVHNYALQNDYDKNKQCIFLRANQENFENLASIYHITQANSLEELTNNIAFVDTVGTVLKIYDGRDAKQIKRLVEHIAIIIQKDAPPDAQLLREAEK